MELVAQADPSLSTSVADALAAAPDVMVDFTIPATALANARAAVDAGVHGVIGTTGWDASALWKDASTSGTPVPRPSSIRPPDNSSTSAAAQAVSIGLRPNAIATPVPSSIRSELSR